MSLTNNAIHKNHKPEKDYKIFLNSRLFVFAGQMIFLCLQWVCTVHRNNFVQCRFAMKTRQYLALQSRTKLLPLI